MLSLVIDSLFLSYESYWEMLGIVKKEEQKRKETEWFHERKCWCHCWSFVPTLMESIIENNDDCEALIVQNYSNFEERITAGKIIVWSWEKELWTLCSLVTAKQKQQDAVKFHKPLLIVGSIAQIYDLLWGKVVAVSLTGRTQQSMWNNTWKQEYLIG